MSTFVASEPLHNSLVRTVLFEKFNKLKAFDEAILGPLDFFLNDCSIEVHKWTGKSRNVVLRHNETGIVFFVWYHKQDKGYAYLSRTFIFKRISDNLLPYSSYELHTTIRNILQMRLSEFFKSNLKTLNKHDIFSSDLMYLQQGSLGHDTQEMYLPIKKFSK
jgi:hypothetical protein